MKEQLELLIKQNEEIKEQLNLMDTRLLQAELHLVLMRKALSNYSYQTNEPIRANLNGKSN